MTEKPAFRVFVLANDDLSSHVIFHRLIHLPKIEVVGVGFARAPLEKRKGDLDGAFALLKKVALRYWLFLVVFNGAFRVFELMTRMLRCSALRRDLASLRRTCALANVPTHTVHDFNAADWLATIRSAQPDLIVARIHTVLRPEALELAEHGVWVVHSSLLPGFKGIAGEFHAIRTGAPVGTSIFRALQKLDAGAPLLQLSTKAPPGEPLLATILANNHAAAGLLADAICELAASGAVVQRLHTPSLPASYHSWPQAEEVTQFRRTGRALLGARGFVRLIASALRL